NAAFFCGSCAVMRRSALDAVGGFATGTVTEDLHTSIKLHKKGYRSIYHAESLAFGLAPATIASFLGQRMRWGQGGMQVWRQEGILLAKGLTLAQRLSYVASVLTYFDGWQKGIFYIVPVIVLSTGWLPVMTINLPFLVHFVPYIVLTYWVFEEVGRGYGRMVLTEEYNMARFFAFAVATLGLFFNRTAFKVTDKSGKRRRSELSLITPQIAVLTLSLAAIPVGCYLHFGAGLLPLNALFANALWAAVNTALALGVVNMTLGRAHRRKEYRFSIPLAVQLSQPNGALEYGTMDDVSSSGFRLYSRSVKELQSVDQFRGLLFLPSGEIEFTARAVPGTGEGRARGRTVGCEFIWDSREARDRLNVFLYGSDLQWRIHSLRDQVATPNELLMTLVKPQQSARGGTEHWAPAMYHSAGAGGSRKLVGLVSTNVSGVKRLLLFDELAENTEIQLSAFGKYRFDRLRARVDRPRVLESNVNPLYLYQLNPA
ncbi:MAG: glycosyltransferase, partial [bacterium]|nr:glycosyltransferase [bacterium]